MNETTQPLKPKVLNANRILILLLLIIGFNSMAHSQIWVKQGGNIEVIEKKKVKISAEAFKLGIKLSPSEALVLHASLSDSLYKIAKNEGIGTIALFNSDGHMMAEDPTEKSWIISHSGLSYWHYATEEDSRFHEFEQEEALQKRMCWRIVESFFFPYYSRWYPDKNFKLEDFSKRTVYVIAVKFGEKMQLEALFKLKIKT